MKSLVVVIALAGCGRGIDHIAYDWDDRRVLCSAPFDDLTGSALDWNSVETHLADAESGQWAVIYHAHTPGVTIKPETIDELLSRAEAHGLAPVTFRELVPSAHRGAIAIAFDDNAPDQWFSIRDLLASHGAHVTFFVSRYTQMTPLGHQELQMLGADGHDIEPHTVNHLHAPDYVAQHGIDAYLADEVLPSFQVLEDAGFPPASAFAYPFGDHTPEIDTAMLPYVAKVRTTPGQCPN